MIFPMIPMLAMVYVCLPPAPLNERLAILQINAIRQNMRRTYPNGLTPGWQFQMARVVSGMSPQALDDTFRYCQHRLLYSNESYDSVSDQCTVVSLQKAMTAFEIIDGAILSVASPFRPIIVASNIYGRIPEDWVYVLTLYCDEAGMRRMRKNQCKVANALHKMVNEQKAAALAKISRSLSGQDGPSMPTSGTGPSMPMDHAGPSMPVAHAGPSMPVGHAVTASAGPSSGGTVRPPPLPIPSEPRFIPMFTYSHIPVRRGDVPTNFQKLKHQLFLIKRHVQSIQAGSSGSVPQAGSSGSIPQASSSGSIPQASCSSPATIRNATQHFLGLPANDVNGLFALCHSRFIEAGPEFVPFACEVVAVLKALAVYTSVHDRLSGRGQSSLGDIPHQWLLILDLYCKLDEATLTLVWNHWDRGVCTKISRMVKMGQAGKQAGDQAGDHAGNPMQID